jgi:hypothetical protein
MVDFTCDSGFDLGSKSTANKLDLALFDETSALSRESLDFKRSIGSKAGSTGFGRLGKIVRFGRVGSV